jgi:hypothetical protein
MKKMTSSTLVISLGFSGLLSLATVTPASAAPCTKKEISTFNDVDSEMAAVYFGFNDAGEAFGYIDAAKKATKNKALKALYVKLERALEEGGTGRTGKSKEAWKALESKIKFKRC